MKPGRITITNNQLVVTCAPHVAIELRRVFGGVQRLRAGMFQTSATPANAHKLEWFRARYPFDVDPAIADRFAALIETENRKLRQIEELDSEDYVPRDFDLAVPPREYQRVAADLALRTRNLLIADDVGLGKTASSICTFTAAGTTPVLVVTLTHLTRQWEKEIARFVPKLRVHRIRRAQPYDFRDVKVEKGPDGRRRVITGNPVPDVIVVNYHKLHGWVEKLAGLVRTIVFDEVQELRIAGSKKYEAATAIAKACDMRLGLSATPIYNYGSEIFAVVDAIAPGTLGEWREFSDEWCGGEMVDGAVRDRRKVCVNDPAALGSFLRESGLMIRRTRKDVGRELPACTIVRYTVEADEGHLERAAADVAELAKRVLSRIGTGIERMQTSSELDNKLRQATGIAKAEAVSDFVRMLVDSGERVVLYGWHHEVYRLWQSAFDRSGVEIPYVMYTGQESDVQKATAARKFIDGEAKVIILSLRAGAGLDGLQKVSRTVVFGELDWSPGVHHQCIGRVHRDGQSEPVMAYYLVAEEGSDPVVADVLGVKEAQSAGLRDPDSAGSPELVGRADDHIRRLAEDVLRRREQQPRRTA